MRALHGPILIQWSYPKRFKSFDTWWRGLQLNWTRPKVILLSNRLMVTNKDPLEDHTPPPFGQSYISNFLIISSNILDIFRLFMRRSQSDSIRQIDSQAWAIWSDSPKVIALNWGNKSFKRKNINWCFCLCSHFDWVWQILNMRRTGCEAVFLGFSNSSRCEEEEMRR